MDSVIINRKNKNPDLGSSGVKELDQLIVSSIPRGYTLLIQGELGTHADLLFIQMIQHQITQKKHVLLVLIDPSSKIVFESIIQNKPVNVTILDATNTSIEGIHQTSHMSLYDLRLRINQMIEDISTKDLAIFYWSLNPLLINYPSRDVLQYFFKRIQDSVIREQREYHFVQSKIADPQVITALSSLAHGVIQLKLDQTPQEDYLTRMRIIKLLGCEYFSNSVILEGT